MQANSPTDPLGSVSLSDLLSPSRASLPSAARWACLLLALGLLIVFFDGAYRTAFIQRAHIVQMGDVEVYAEPDWSSIPPTVRLAAIASWALVFASALLAVFGGSARAVPQLYLWLYAGMWFVSAYLLIGVTANPVHVLTTSTALLAKLAPGTLLALGVFFLAADPEAWRYIRRFLIWLAAIVSVAWLASAFRMTHPSRAEAYRWIFDATLALEVVALLPVGAAAQARPIRRAVSLVPLILLFLGGVLLQARLLVVLFAFLVLVYAVLRSRAGALAHESVRRRAMFGALVVAPVVFAVILTAWPFVQESIAGGSARALWARRAQETRIRQIQPFFQKATLDRLLLGAGYPNKGEYTGEGPDGIDCGYLNSLYVTGLPMMLLFVAMLVVPAVRCLRLRLTAADAAVVASALAYCVRLASSTVPAFSAQFLIACLLMGRCAFLLHAARHAAADAPLGVAEPSETIP